MHFAQEHSESDIKETYPRGPTRLLVDEGVISKNGGTAVESICWVFRILSI